MSPSSRDMLCSPSPLVRQLPDVVPLKLDLADRASIDEVLAAAVDQYGPISTLINNAGYGEFGSIEETSDDRARRQFDVNVFGLTQVTRRVIGPMREAGRGRIVNVSSLAGEFSSPMAGWYHASKYAVEALSDSLRAELRRFGVKVVIVQPGPVRTPWHDEALGLLNQTSRKGPYAEMAAAVTRYHQAAQDQPITSEASDVASVIVEAATTSSPRVRYRVGRGAGTAVALSRLPPRIFDAMVRKQFGIG